MKKSVKGTQTEINLLKAFAGETQARNRYEWFAQQAKKEGLVQIATLFNETATHERSHAKQFFRFLEGGNLPITATFSTGLGATTLDNLKEAALGELHEWSELYPQFAEVAENEGFTEIAVAFKAIAKIEKWHEERFKTLYHNLEAGKVFERDEKVVWICSVCGFLHESKKAPLNCPVCHHPQAYFHIEMPNY